MHSFQRFEYSSHMLFSADLDMPHHPENFQQYLVKIIISVTLEVHCTLKVVAICVDIFFYRNKNYKYDRQLVASRPLYTNTNASTITVSNNNPYKNVDDNFFSGSRGSLPNRSEHRMLLKIITQSKDQHDMVKRIIARHEQKSSPAMAYVKDDLSPQQLQLETNVLCGT